jgi:hypothetical protein
MTQAEMSQEERNFDAHFGGCPQCGHHDGIVNVGSGHWLHCAEHKVKWCVGSNLFDFWKDQTEEEQRKIWAETIGRTGYREITCEEAHTHPLVRQWESEWPIATANAIAEPAPDDVFVFEPQTLRERFRSMRPSKGFWRTLLPIGLRVALARRRGDRDRRAGVRRSGVPITWRTPERSREALAWMDGWNKAHSDPDTARLIRL